MSTHDIVFAFFLIFFGASVLATLALFTRQSLIIAYMLIGIIVGPFGLHLIPQTTTITSISKIGIMFLLFLLGLNLQPRNLFAMLRGATIVTLASGIIFASLSILIGLHFGFDLINSFLIGVALMFSSTIIGLKLLPTTALHHQHIGQAVVSVLLLQDIIAIIVLLVLNVFTVDQHGTYMMAIIRTIIGVPILVLVGYFVERHILHRLFHRFDRIREYVFLLAIGWCLGMAILAEFFHISLEIGAFIAGVSLASSPISQYIAESLKPLRDFFLIIFFFSIGAGFNFHLLPTVFLLVIVLTLLTLLIKPLIFRFLMGEIDGGNRKTAWEIGFRLGQASEFSLLVGFLAYQSKLLSEPAYICIQAVTILTFIISSYIVVLKYPSPLAIRSELRRD